jgi:hypothetical protein
MLLYTTSTCKQLCILVLKLMYSIINKTTLFIKCISCQQPCLLVYFMSTTLFISVFYHVNNHIAELALNNNHSLTPGIPYIEHIVTITDQHRTQCLIFLLQFPLCDGSHSKYNTETGDNVGPLVLKRKST